MAKIQEYPGFVPIGTGAKRLHLASADNPQDGGGIVVALCARRFAPSAVHPPKDVGGRDVCDACRRQADLRIERACRERANKLVDALHRNGIGSRPDPVGRVVLEPDNGVCRLLNLLRGQRLAAPETNAKAHTENEPA